MLQSTPVSLAWLQMQYMWCVFKENIGKMIQWLEKWIVMRLHSSVLWIPRDALARAECQLCTRSEEDVVEDWA